MFDPFTFTKHWNFQITLPMLEIKKMIIDTGNSRKYIQKTVKLIPQKTLLRLKISKILILVDISSRRILSKMFFSQTKEIITVSNYRPFIQIFQSEKHEPKNKTSFFVLSELTIFFTLLSSEKKLYWRMLMKLDNRFFGIPRKKGTFLPPGIIPFGFGNLKLNNFCTGLKIWIRTFQENWGTIESNFLDINGCESRNPGTFQFSEVGKKTNLNKSKFNKKQRVFLNY